MINHDSVDKVVNSYFACIALEPFTYKKKVYTPKPLIISPLINRGFTCPSGCGGCCRHFFTLDWLPEPTEWHPYPLTQRFVEFDGKQVELWTDFQEGNTTGQCRHLIQENGRCGIHGNGKTKEFTGDFELIRFLVYSAPSSANRLTQKLYGRGWSYTRVDGQKGALCEMTPITEETIADTARRLERLKQWADHFGVVHDMDKIISFIKSHPVHPMTYNPDQKSDHVNILNISN